MAFIVVDTEALKRAERLLRGVPGGIEKAAGRARGRALEAARTEATRRAVETYDTKQAIIRGSITLNKGAGTMISRGSPMNLMKFKVTPSSPKRALVRASVKRSPKTLADAFVAQMKSGHIGVFRRVGKKRFPIKPLYSVSPAQMVGEPTVIQSTEERAYQVFHERLQHEVVQVLSRY